jgi:hypothetical protein
MNSKHTPGPWTVTGPSFNIRARGCLVAQVLIQPSGIDQANARLIAEAPELYTLAQHAARQDVAPDVIQKRARALLARIGEV